MSLEGLVLDGLDIDDGSTYRVVESLDISPPPKRLLWIAGREGDILGDVPGSERRAVTFKVMVTGATMDTALTALGALTDKLQKAERTTGGISLVWTPSGSSYSKTIKVLAGEITDLPLSPDALYFRNHPVVTVRLDCKPFLYGSETSYATVTSSAPHVVAMARSVAGDVPAEGRLILTDMASQERDFAEYGLDPDPVTMETLALSYTPSLFLRLGSSSGLTDQSGNGYNGTAQGGVTVGGATSLLTGDDSAATDFDGSNDYISTTYSTIRNYIRNGSAEVDLTAIGNVPNLNAGATRTRVAEAGTGAGSYRVEIATTAGSAFQGISYLLNNQTYTSGVTYRAAIDIDYGSNPTELEVLLGKEGTDSGTAVTLAASPSSGRQRIVVTWTPSANRTASDDYALTVRTKTAVAKTFWTDAALMVEGASTSTLYFDGSGYVNASSVWVPNPSTGNVPTGWLGTAHASASDKGALANGTVRSQSGVFARDNTSAIHTLFGGSATSNATRLVLASGSRNVLFIIGGTTYTYTTAWPNDTAGHVWEHVFDETNDTADLYIDGALFEHKTSVTAQHAASQSFQVGAYGAGSDPADGKGQDVAAWERALTADEIRQLYTAAISPYLFDSSKLSTTGLAATGSTRSGAYDPVGSGNTVLRVTTQTNWVGSCETGAIPHYGPFRAKARIYTDATDAQIRVAYKSGDAPFKRLNPVVLASGLASQWQEVDLGMLDIPQAQLGTQRTIVRIEVKSATSNKTFDVDYLELIPATRYTLAAAPIPTIAAAAGVFSAASGFDTESGAITGDSLAVGGTWTGAGDADDATVAGGVATRSAVSDTFAGGHKNGRLLTASSSTLTGTAAKIDLKRSTDGSGLSLEHGLILRYVDSSNFLTVDLQAGAVTNQVTVAAYKWIAGSGSAIAPAIAGIAFPYGAYGTLGAVVDAAGKLVVTLNGNVIYSGQDSALATGGTLASGKVGWFDYYPVATAMDRTYDNFACWAAEADAAIFSGKTLEFRYDDTIRQDSTGTYYGRPSVARGPGMFIPQAGSESKVTRIVAKACRNDIRFAARDNIADSTKLEVRATSRSLVTPR